MFAFKVEKMEIHKLIFKAAKIDDARIKKHAKECERNAKNAKLDESRELSREKDK